MSNDSIIEAKTAVTAGITCYQYNVTKLVFLRVGAKIRLIIYQEHKQVAFVTVIVSYTDWSLHKRLVTGTQSKRIA